MHCTKWDQFGKIKAHTPPKKKKKIKEVVKEKSKPKEPYKENKQSTQRGQRWRGKANLQAEGQPEQPEKKYV